MQLKENQTVAMFHLGGLGDLVLSSVFIVSFKSAYPHTKLTLICKREFASLTELFPVKPDAVIGLDLNPHLVDQPSEALHRSLQQIMGLFAGFRPDLLVECSLRPTWLSFFLNSLLKPAHSFCCALEFGPTALLPIVLNWFALPDLELPNVGLPSDLSELERYGLLLDALSVPRGSSFPWQPPAGLEAQAGDWLEANGLPGNGFVACFPGGSPGSEIKRWPKEKFIRALDKIRARGFEILLLGSTVEREYLNRISCVLERGPVPVFADSGAIQLFASLLSRAAAYLGNDTGPMHLAQAYGIPGVAIFGGGGQWPRYSAWAHGFVGAVHPLPCFGCSWDCFLGHGLCVESIPVEPVVDALFRVLEGKREPPATLTLTTLDSTALGLIADASAEYRAAQADRARRMGTILQLDHANRALDAGNRSKEAEIERAGAAFVAIQAEADARAAIIEELKKALRESDSRTASLIEDLTRLEYDRAEQARRFQAEMSGRDARIAEVQGVADDRLAVLEGLRREAVARSRALEEVTAALQDREKRVAELEVLNSNRLSMIEAIHREAEARSRALDHVTAALHEREKRVAELEAIGADRLAMIEAIHREAEARGHALLEVTAALEARDYRIGESERRLETVNATAEDLRKLTADRLAEIAALHSELAARDKVVEELTAAVHERDIRIAGSGQELAVIQENLESSMADVAERDLRIAGIYKIADERLAVLERTHLEAAKRLSIMDEMSAAIEGRDRRIADLERSLTSRLGRFIGERFGGTKK